ncbi:MAG: hypothetical protein L6R30_27195, partial [Thermoanaerobaculia bacterium]|nr:hypothetical protein [Thermoanaerobaculia bacterium]
MAKAAAGDEPWPLLLPGLALVMQAASLVLGRRVAAPADEFPRLGFHAGVAVYMLGAPVLFPGSARSAYSADVHLDLGLAIMVCVIGFEIVWNLLSTAIVPSRAATRGRWEASSSAETLLVAGLVAGALSYLIVAIGLGADVDKVFFSMRGQIEGARSDVSPWYGYLSGVLAGGFFVAGAAGVVVMGNRKSAMTWRMAALLVQLTLCGVGFLRGSR